MLCHQGRQLIHLITPHSTGSTHLKGFLQELTRNGASQSSRCLTRVHCWHAQAADRRVRVPAYQREQRAAVAARLVGGHAADRAQGAHQLPHAPLHRAGHLRGAQGALCSDILLSHCLHFWNAGPFSAHHMRSDRSVVFLLPLYGLKFCAVCHTAVVTLSPVGWQDGRGRDVMFSSGAWEQVLGGAGPAIAAVPLTVVWAGGSFVTLATGLGAGKVGPIGAVQRVGYVFFMSIAQVWGCHLHWPLPPLFLARVQDNTSAMRLEGCSERNWCAKCTHCCPAEPCRSQLNGTRCRQ